MNTAERALRDRLETSDFQCSFLVEAGAGAGKSYTICRRILHQLLDGRDPGTIAAITFTEKATLELQEKLDRLALDYDGSHPGEHLASRTAQIHISTIHSFCQTALGLFPLETGGALQVLPEETVRAKTFFRAWTARDEDGSASAFETFGGSVRSLEDTFAAMAEEGHVPALPAAADVQAHQAKLDGAVDRAHQALRKHLTPHGGFLTFLPEDLRQAAEAPSLTPELSAALRRVLGSAWKAPSRPKRLRALFFTENPSVSSWLEEYMEASKKSTQKTDPDRLKKVPPVFAAMDAFQAELDRGGPAPSLVEQIAQGERVLGYDLALGVLAPALEAYLSQRDRAGLVTFSGLLTRTRDLVRDNPAARALLHRRYQVFYVDEFQDTDPVQAELLFLITDQGGRERDWTRCRPTPGSLFLVGDPKQAIYRFRGADLGVYKQVRDLFSDTQSPVGEVVYLQANFRSVPEICAFVDKVFAPRDEDGNILSLTEQAKNRNNKTVTEFLDDGAYQAPYVPMEAQQKSPGQGAVFSYDAQRPGGGVSKVNRVVQFIQQATARGFALPDQDGNLVPVRYRDFLVLTWRKRTAGEYLDALSKVGIPVSFSGSRSLSESPQMKRLAAWLNWLLEPGDEIALLSVLRDCFGLRSFEIVRQLRAASQYPLTLLAGWKEKRDEVTNPGLKPLLDVLAEMDAVLADCRALPPMAFLEKLAEERLFRRGDASAPQERGRQYGDMRLLLGQLRQCGDFPALARAALTLCQGVAEQELPLTPSPDAVRVMNLHKAKGLEGKIVILAADTSANLPPQKAGGVYPIVRTYAHGNSTLLYAPEEWSEKEKEERACLAAEQVRLFYVAATRAEQLLLIAGDKVTQARKSCWDAMAGKADRFSVRDPRWGNFMAPLLASGGGVPPVSAPAAGPAPQDLTACRERRIQSQSVPASLHASPSTLDKSHVRRPLDPEEAPEELDPPLPEETPGGPEAPERSEPFPHGADWGTAVHRLLELCVSQKVWEREAARPLIAQALRETIPPLSRLTGTQKKLLFGDSLPEHDGAGAERLAGQLEQAVSFWFEEASPLRRLTGAGTCYCELPFHLELSREDESWPFLRERLDCREDFAGNIRFSGILDLAVLTEEGWHIVDYKTDRLRPGEDAAAYRRRLAGEYGAQLNAYIRILSKLSGKAVLDARLCSIPLGGAWIPIPKNA